MKARCFVAWVMLALVVGLAVPVVPAAAQQKDKLKVGFVYVSHANDMGWSWAHDQGRIYMEQVLGDRVETSYVEAVPEGADSERVFADLARTGHDLVFGTSFGYMDSMVRVSRQFPDVTFMHATGLRTTDNLGIYFGRIEQPRYLTGIVAGLQTQSNIIGYVAAHPIPEVIRGINAFTLGVRSVNPDAEVRVVWTNTWYDPAKEKDAAVSLLDLGADVIAQHQDTPAPAQAAEERGKWAVGYNADFTSFAPKAHLTAPVWNWGPYYVSVVESVMNGTWTNEFYWGGMEDGIVDISPLADFVHPDAPRLVEEARQRILSGEWDVFHGPIRDQSGQLRVAEGEALTDDEQLSMQWFVEGVRGTIPR